MPQPQRVIEQPQEGDPHEIDDPAPQVGLEQVQSGPFIEHGQGSERHQRRGHQDRAERECQLLAPVVDPGEPGPDKTPDACGNDQQSDQYRDR